MSMGSAGSQRGWRVGRDASFNALEVVLLDRTYVLPWSQFVFAEGGDDEVRIVFATHDVLAKGYGLQHLLSDLAAQRVIGLDEPTRAERFGSGNRHSIHELTVHKVDA